MNNPGLWHEPVTLSRAGDLLQSKPVTVRQACPGKMFERPRPKFEFPCTALEIGFVMFERPGTTFEIPCVIIERPCATFEIVVVMFERPGITFEIAFVMFERPCATFERPFVMFERSCVMLEIASLSGIPNSENV